MLLAPVGTTVPFLRFTSFLAQRSTKLHQVLETNISKEKNAVTSISMPLYRRDRL